MNIINAKKIFLLFLILTILTISTTTLSFEINNIENTNYNDFDPLVDIELTVEIKSIRSLERYDYPNPSTKEIIDFFGDPDFFIKIIINNQEFESSVWNDEKYIYNSPFFATLNIPDDIEFVDIKIQLFDWNSFGNRLCDISGQSNKMDIDLIYSIKTGHWSGDDELFDPSGYGRLNGCDDGSIKKQDRDCEILFDIYQNDYDNDGIPYWTEVNIYSTDPKVDNRGYDPNNDGIPIEWDWKWDYDPFANDNHHRLDPDDDGLNNKEEYIVSLWDSDPFREDIYIEFDQMETSPDNIECILCPGAKELLFTAFNIHNKVFHIDDGLMGGGGDIIPFDQYTSHSDIGNIYWNYFLEGNENNWRRGVFRYSVFVYEAAKTGFVFERGAFIMSLKLIDPKIIPYTQESKDRVIASGYMHEVGHTLGIYNPGVDNRNTYNPLQIGWWIYGPYKSTMNYRYSFRLVDYSDGSNIINDYNDWEDMNLNWFQGHL